jgi:hypothetical protein
MKINGTIPTKFGQRERVVVLVDRGGRRPAQHGVYLTRKKKGLYVEPDSYPGQPFEAEDLDAVYRGMP